MARSRAFLQVVGGELTVQREAGIADAGCTKGEGASGEGGGGMRCGADRGPAPFGPTWDPLAAGRPKAVVY
ncbi:hypothetical protein Stube_01790 [Streptomyces tubercidicus]|uniref:Uncharacterized protein n=1 Tax=Streptomyces tubercidicus TaxID=47759 RepID=A0A640UMZ9_9ACTN|nr:hypothetical protein Stube_01790 [Streptomyces tubercidicus]